MKWSHNSEIVIGRWHLLESIRVEFAQQSRDRLAGSLRVGVLADCADHPSAIDSFPKRPFVGPTELPNIWTALATNPDKTPVLHSYLRIAVAMRRNSYAGMQN